MRRGFLPKTARRKTRVESSVFFFTAAFVLGCVGGYFSCRAFGASQEIKEYLMEYAKALSAGKAITAASLLGAAAAYFRVPWTVFLCSLSRYAFYLFCCVFFGEGLLLAFAASVMLQVVLLAIVWIAGRLMGLNEVEKASVYYSNAGNLIMPIVTFVLGQEWVLYGCVFMSVQIVFVWSHGKWVLSRQSKIDWKKILLNINMVAVFAGVFLFFTKIRLPQILNQTFGSVGSMIGPASMMVTGMLIAEMSLKDIFTNGRVYFITFLRLIAVPAVALLLLKVSGLVNGSPDGKKLLLIVFLAVITPSASTITQMCQVYGNDSQYASAINVMTTLFSIVTMPLMVLLFQMIL